MNSEMTKVVTLHVNDVLPNRFQPRIRFNEEKINELADSIKKYGVIQPITVRRIGDKYEIIAGERRYKATVLAGLTEIPAIINNLNDKDSSEVALIENVQREDLTPIEEAISYKKILDMGDLTQEELAERLGMSQSTVANKLRLLHLSEEVQDALLQNKISERHARSLLRIHDTKKQIEMLHIITKNRLTVRQTDDEIKRLLEGNNKAKKIIDMNEKEDLKENKASKFDETEILELINMLEETKGDEEEMNNNDPINQFDIPNVNIINDVPSTQREPIGPVPLPVQAVPTIPDNNLMPQEIRIEEPMTPKMDNSTNPGFMDIDKIEREAIDITPKEEKEEDHSFLLENPISLEPQRMEDISEIKEPIGRFFNEMPSLHPNQGETIDTNNGRTTDRMQGSIFSDSGSIFSNLEPVPDAPEPSTQVINILESPSIEPKKEVVVPMPQINTVPELAPVIEETKEIEIPLMTEIPPIPEVASPVVEPIREIEMPTFTTIPPMQEVISPVVEPISEVKVPSITSINEEWTQPIPPKPVEPIEEPVVQPVIPEIVEEVSSKIVEAEAVPNANPFEAPIVPLVPPSMIGEPIQSNVISFQNPIELPKDAPQPKSEIQPLSFKAREGINTVRNVVHQLESIGLKVDIEEMDLPGTYQIMIKIEK